MSLINLQAVQDQVLQTDPYEYIVVPDFLGPRELQQVNGDYPSIDTAANHALDSLSYGDVFGQLMEEIQQPALARILGEKFDMELESLPTTITARKFCERTDGNIHTDHKSKVITVLLYFNEDWDSEDGQLRILRSSNNIDDYAAQVPPLGGTMLAFKRTDHSWHGHTQYVGERRMVQLNYLDQSPIAVVAQRVSRFGTHFMKNVLGMR